MEMDASRLVIISGPSGVGKSTVVKRVLEDSPVPLVLSISATTREPRDGEVDGVHYHFLSRQEFEERRQKGEFLEFKEVFRHGNWYGTLKSTVASGLSEGKWVLLEIDVEGAISVSNEYPDVLMIFLHPGSMEILEKRLRDRQSDSEESISRRLQVAAAEMAQSELYDHVIENRTIDQTAERICGVIAERANASPS
ncbi:MAG: guanylate kinase [Planctomycetota bacterium]|nr:guanylate kinase [Planctomycetota bacterium]